MSDAHTDRAYRHLRASSTADLRFDEHFRPLKYVIAPDGRLVAPVMVAMLRSVDTVLFIPEVAQGAMEVQVTLDQFDEHGPDGTLADRWRIHHGAPPDVNWALLDIDAARFDGLVIDGQALMRPNPLAPDEPAFCRRINQHHTADLRALAHRFADVNLEHPVLVAVDPLGFDIRGRFDVIRVNATGPIPTIEDAEHTILAMIETARAAAPGE